MKTKTLVIIDTDTEFRKRFQKRLKIEKLDQEFKIVDIVPDTTNRENLIDNAIEKVNALKRKGLDISAIFVDIVIIETGARYDISGIKIASRLKNLFPRIPIYNISSKVIDNDQLDIFSEATIENNDGVFAKYFLEGDTFNKSRLKKIIKPNYRKTKINGTFPNEKTKTYDIAVITSLYEDEFENLKEIFQLKATYEDSAKIYFTGQKKIENKKDTIIANIIAVNQHKTGMVDAAVFATEIVLKYRPKFLVMTGVCGGRTEDDIEFGDIVVANKIFLFQKGKISENNYDKELESIDIDEKLISKIRIKERNILRSVEDKDHSRRKQYKKRPLHLHIEPMACGFAVIDKNGYFKENIEIIKRKTVAVDMESYSIARLCQVVNEKNTVPIIIKSVMDKTTGKNDTEKSYASFTSALFFNFLIDEVLIEYL